MAVRAGTIRKWCVDAHYIDSSIELHVEETIILQEENDLIDTPLERANISDGVHPHNHMTLIWDVAVADRIAHRRGFSHQARLQSLKHLRQQLSNEKTTPIN
jgi:hypothetical protein